jgi:hypothetical protein
VSSREDDQRAVVTEECMADTRHGATNKDRAIGCVLTVMVALISLAVAGGMRSVWEREFPGGRTRAPGSPGEVESGPVSERLLFLSVPAPSPDGRWLAWTGWLGGKGGLLAMPAEGGTPVVLDEAAPAPPGSVAWSTDGARIAWLARAGLGRPTVVRVYDLESQAPHAITERSLRAAPAAGVHWWPGAEALLYVDPASDRLYRHPLDAESPTVAADGVAADEAGDGLSVVETRDGVVAFDDDSRHRLMLPERRPLLDYCVPSPDGAMIAEEETPALDAAQAAIISVAPIGWEAEERYSRAAPSWSAAVPSPCRLAWSPDSSRLLVALTPAGVRSAVGAFRDQPDADAVVLSRDDGSVWGRVNWPDGSGDGSYRWLGNTSLLYLNADTPQHLWRVDARVGTCDEMAPLAAPSAGATRGRGR